MGKWFDNVARAAAGGLSRREMVRRLGGGVFGTALAALFGVRTAEAETLPRPPFEAAVQHASGCAPRRQRVNGRNVPGTGPGQGCSRDNPCPSECYCTRDGGACARKKPVGQRCLSDIQCQSGVCDGNGTKVCVDAYNYTT